MRLMEYDPQITQIRFRKATLIHENTRGRVQKTRDSSSQSEKFKHSSRNKSVMHG